MTHSPDLSPCRYFADADWLFIAGRWAPASLFAGRLLGIGWLEVFEEYSRGSLDSPTQSKLAELAAHPLAQAARVLGYHRCSLCRYAPRSEPITQRDLQAIPYAKGNLFVPGVDCVYVMPVLATHYIEAHGYLPPEEFCTAVRDCPPIGSNAYFAKLHPTGAEAFSATLFPPDHPSPDLGSGA